MSVERIANIVVGTFILGPLLLGVEDSPLNNVPAEFGIKDGFC